MNERTGNPKLECLLKMKFYYNWQATSSEDLTHDVQTLNIYGGNN